MKNIKVELFLHNEPSRLRYLHDSDMIHPPEYITDLRDGLVLLFVQNDHEDLPKAKEIITQEELDTLEITKHSCFYTLEEKNSIAILFGVVSMMLMVLIKFIKRYFIPIALFFVFIALLKALQD